ncbi:MAG TPA: hypothetical protein VEB66_12830 [Opitutaceae bacterium]|nr:hypothetical protein [Opitutaceae bacterium]
MTADPAPVPPPADLPKNSFGATPDPWIAAARLDYGADRTLASAVRDQVVHVATAPERDRVEEKLLAALASPDARPAGRAFLCEMLALAGSARSVPALAALLRDPATSDAGRYALEAIPGPEATAALRDALAVLAGPARAGVVGSLAARGEEVRS